MNGRKQFTEISIFILIPKIEMLLYRLVAVEADSMSSTPHKEGVPVELTHAIMCMSMKHANHKPKECIFHLF
jgi:hypothetical protein